MSRVAKQPVTLPKGVAATITAAEVTVKGSKGTLSLPLRVGLAFVPAQAPHGTRFTETSKNLLAQQVADTFRAQDFISYIEIIPTVSAADDAPSQGKPDANVVFSVEVSGETFALTLFQTDTDDNLLRSQLVDDLNALFAAHDNGDYYLAHGASAGLETGVGLGLDLTIGARVERQTAVARAAVRTPWRPNSWETAP